MAVKNDALPAASDLIRVEVTWLDGTTEEFEAAACQLPAPGVLLLVTPRDGDIGISLAAIRRWHGRRSKLAVLIGSN